MTRPPLSLTATAMALAIPLPRPMINTVLSFKEVICFSPLAAPIYPRRVTASFFLASGTFLPGRPSGEFLFALYGGAEQLGVLVGPGRTGPDGDVRPARQQDVLHPVRAGVFLQVQLDVG